MRVIAAFFGPYAPEALTSYGSVFSHDFKRFERFTKLATSSLAKIMAMPFRKQRPTWQFPGDGSPERSALPGTPAYLAE
jgi:hypothetical protein